jgi:hypothetical protein
MTQDTNSASIGGVIAAGCILLLTVAWSWSTSEETVPISHRDANACLKGEPIAATTAVLVDVTDPLTTEHQTQVDALLPALKRQTPTNGKVILAGLTPTAGPEPLTTLFSGCNPGTKSGSFLDRPAAAPADRWWVKRFSEPLDAAFSKLPELPNSPNGSPILQAITALSTRADFDSQVPNRTLVIVTDGLQLTPGTYSHFKSTNLWKDFERSGLPQQTQADLKDVSVKFVYLLRPEFANRQTQAHRDFWLKWFKDHGARSVTFRGIATSDGGTP